MATEYTPVMVAALAAMAPVDNAKATAFAEKYGISVQSVRAKAVRAGIYQAKPKTRKDGSPVERKDAIVSDMEKMLGLSEGRLETLGNATRDALVIVRDALNAASDESE